MGQDLREEGKIMSTSGTGGVGNTGSIKPVGYVVPTNNPVTTTTSQDDATTTPIQGAVAPKTPADTSLGISQNRLDNLSGGKKI